MSVTDGVRDPRLIGQSVANQVFAGIREFLAAEEAPELAYPKAVSLRSMLDAYARFCAEIEQPPVPLLAELLEPPAAGELDLLLRGVQADPVFVDLYLSVLHRSHLPTLH